VQLRPFKATLPAGEMFDEFGDQLFQVRMLRKAGTDFREWPDWAQRIDCAARMVQIRWRGRMRKKYQGGLGGLLDGAAGLCSGPAMVKTEWGWQPANDPWAELRAQVLSRTSRRRESPDMPGAHVPLQLEFPDYSKMQPEKDSSSEDGSEEEEEDKASNSSFPSPSTIPDQRSGGPQSPLRDLKTNDGPSSNPSQINGYKAWNPNNSSRVPDTSGMKGSPMSYRGSGQAFAGYERSSSNAKAKDSLLQSSVEMDGDDGSGDRFASRLKGSGMPSRSSEGNFGGWEAASGDMGIAGYAGTNAFRSGQNQPEHLNPEALLCRRQAGGRASLHDDSTSPSPKRKSGFGIGNQLPIEFVTGSSRKLAAVCQGVLGARHEFYKWKNRYFRPVLAPRKTTTMASAPSVAQFAKWTSVMKLRMIALLGDQAAEGNENVKPHLQHLAEKIAKMGVKKDFHAAMSIFSELTQRVDQGETISKRLAEEVEYWLGRLLDDFNNLLREEVESRESPEAKWGINRGEIKQDLAIPRWLEELPSDSTPFLIVKAFPGLGDPRLVVGQDKQATAAVDGPSQARQPGSVLRGLHDHADRPAAVVSGGERATASGGGGRGEEGADTKPAEKVHGTEGEVAEAAAGSHRFGQLLRTGDRLNDRCRAAR